MTTAVEPAATELRVANFLDHRTAPHEPASLSPALQLHGFPSKSGLAVGALPHPHDSPVLPHWMDSKQIQSRPATDHAAAIEFLSELCPSTPMQGTPRPKLNVETPQDHPHALLHTRGSQQSNEDQKVVPLPLELVGKPSSSIVKQAVQQSCSPTKVSPEQQSQKENLLTFSLGTSKPPVQATPKGQSPQPRLRAAQPSSTRALATLTASRISIAPEDLQLQQPVKGIQQPPLADNQRKAALLIGGAGASFKRGLGVMSSGALNGSIQFDLFKPFSSATQLNVGSRPHVFAPMSRASPTTPTADGTGHGPAPPKFALHFQDASLQPEHGLRPSTSTATAPRWADVRTPGTAHGGPQWHERALGLTPKTPSPGMLLAPRTPFEGGAQSLRTATPAKDCNQSLEELEIKVYGNLSRKRRIASPEKVLKAHRTAVCDSPGQEQHYVDDSKRAAGVYTVGGWTRREQHPGSASTGLQEQPRLPSNREHMFFPATTTADQARVTTKEKATPNGFRDHVQFVSPKKEQGLNNGVGTSSVVSVTNNFKNAPSGVPQSGAGTPATVVDSRFAKYHAVPAHSPMPVADATISAGEPSLPLSLNFAHSIPQGSKAPPTKMTAMRSETDWGKSLALAASPMTQDSPFRQRYAELQMYLKYCDEVRHEHLVEVFRSMSAAGRSGHALRLETRALFLNFEEGREMDRLRSLNIMGAQARDSSTRDLGELGCTPHGPRLPAPGNTSAS